MNISIVVIDNAAKGRLRLRESLGDAGADVVATISAQQNISEVLSKTRANAVLLELDDADSLRLARAFATDHPLIPLVVYARSKTRGAALDEALKFGATDAVLLEEDTISKRSMSRLLSSILARLAMGRLRDSMPPSIARIPPPQAPSSPKPPVIDVVAIGVSTGGPEALQELIPNLSDTLDVPILVVQHMPPKFTLGLANRLNTMSPVSVKEAESNERLQGGTVYIAPGGVHLSALKLGKHVLANLQDGPLVNNCKPAVDVLLKSLVRAYQAKRVLVAIMTGMGHDGLEGCRQLKAGGAHILAQSRQSCTVWGMSRAVEEEGLCNEVVALHSLANRINQLAGPAQQLPINEAAP